MDLLFPWLNLCSWNTPNYTIILLSCSQIAFSLMLCQENFLTTKIWGLLIVDDRQKRSVNVFLLTQVQGVVQS